MHQTFVHPAPLIDLLSLTLPILSLLMASLLQYKVHHFYIHTVKTITATFTFKFSVTTIFEIAIRNFFTQYTRLSIIRIA